MKTFCNLSKPALLWILFELFFSPQAQKLHAQHYDKALVTDLNFMRRPGELVNEGSFPFYFHYPEFAADVQSDIEKHLKSRFGVNEVLFTSDDSIFYFESILAPKTRAKEYARSGAVRVSLYVAVETILQEYAYLNNEQLFRFTTRVSVYNAKGKEIYSFKNHIPFVSYFGDEITGLADMGEEDFYAFYFDGLQYAFEGKNEVSNKRYIEKPTAKRYSDFTGQSEKFYLVTESDGYSYGKSMDERAEIVRFTQIYWENYGQAFDFSNLVTLEFLDNGYHFINRLNQTEYLVRIKSSVQSLQQKTDPMDDIDLQLLDASGKHIGYFTYYGVSRFSGKYIGRDYRFDYSDYFNCLEVYADDILIALINPRYNQKILFLTPSISREQLQSLINLIFVYDYALAIRNKAIEVYGN